MFYSYNNEEKVARSQIQLIKKSYLPSISSSVWDFNTNYLELHLEAIRNLPYVEYVSFIEKEATKDQDRHLEESSKYEMEYLKVYHSKKYLGNLYIGIDTVGLKHTYFRKALNLLLLQGVKTFFVCGLLLWIFNFVIMRHLKTISSYLENFNSKEDKDLNLMRKSVINDEFTLLERVINHLREEILEKQSNLEKINLNLERIVDERTKERDQERMKLMYASKMASLGEMAGGIAHEINNPLAIISSCITVQKKARIRGKLNEELLEKIENDIAKTIRRISRIISGLRTVSRDSSDLKKEPVVIRDIFEDVLGLCLEKFKNNGIEFRFNFEDPNLNKKIICDRVQVSQVFVNLIGNAFDAVEFLQEKWVKIEIEEDDNFYVFKVIDSGAGIPEEIQEKMFTPFYTSKKIGKGTGLGLSLSKSITEVNDGILDIDNSHENTCFVVQLMKADDEK